MSEKRKQCDDVHDDDDRKQLEKKQKTCLFDDIWLHLNHIGKDAMAWLRYDFISTEEEKQQLFEMMRDQIPWIRHVLYKNSNKEMKQARLSCSMGAAYAYSGSIHPQSDWHPKVMEIMNRINQEYDTKFNSCLLNFYQDGSQYISAHSDQDQYLDKQKCLVVGLSLGQERIMTIRSKNQAQLNMKPIYIPLANGSLFGMQGKDFQRLLTHGIDKAKAHEVMGPRISLTFRCFVAS